MVSDERAEFKRKVNVSSTLSATANLLRIATTVKGAHCEALLGIGHLHHGQGYCLQMAAKGKSCGRVPKFFRSKIRWGFRYTHFFYTVDPRHPFGILAIAPEFCIASHTRTPTTARRSSLLAASLCKAMTGLWSAMASTTARQSWPRSR